MAGPEDSVTPPGDEREQQPQAAAEEPVEPGRRDKRRLDLLDPEFRFEDVQPVSDEDLEQAVKDQVTDPVLKILQKSLDPKEAVISAAYKLGLPETLALLAQEFGNERFRDALRSPVVRKARSRLSRHTMATRVGFARFCKAHGAGTDIEAARWIAEALRRRADSDSIRVAIGNAERRLQDDPEEDAFANFIAGIIEEQRFKAGRSAHAQLRGERLWLSMAFSRTWKK
jgi:hypothetical protein